MRTLLNSSFILAATICLALATTGYSWLALKAGAAQAAPNQPRTPKSMALVAEPQVLTAQLLVSVPRASDAVTHGDLSFAATRTGAAWLLLMAVVCLPVLSTLSGFKARRKPIRSQVCQEPCDVS